MDIRLGAFCCLLAIIIAAGSPIVMSPDAYAQRQEESLDWSIETAKNTFYPGEPVLLTLNIKNSGTQEEKVHFGVSGIDAFLMEIRDSNNIIITKGSKIERFGFTARSPLLDVPPGKIAQKPIVLNRWCSTLLSPGQYRVVCRIDHPGKFYSEEMRFEDRIIVVPKRHYEPMSVVELDIQIIEMDKTKFKEMLEAMVGFEVKPESQSKGEWLAKRDTAREMLAFTESELAVPYQLRLLRTDPANWFRRDIINSLVRSGTLDAAGGLIQIIEDPSIPSIYKEDIKQEAIDAIYRLRETGKAEIINATEEFVAKYKRPILILSKAIGLKDEADKWKLWLYKMERRWQPAAAAPSQLNGTHQA